jgi:hypothetical protein
MSPDWHLGPGRFEVRVESEDKKIESSRFDSLKEAEEYLYYLESGENYELLEDGKIIEKNTK